MPQFPCSTYTISPILLRRAQECRGEVWPGLGPVLHGLAEKPPFLSLDLTAGRGAKASGWFYFESPS